MFLNSVREEMNQYNQRNCSKKCAVNSGLQEVDDFEITNGPEKGKIKLNGFVNGIAVDSTHHQTKNSKKKTKTEPDQHIINTFAESEVKHAQDEKRPEFQSISNGKRKDSKSSTGTKPKKNHSEVNSDPKDTLPINCSESLKCELNEGKCCVKDFEARTLISAVEEIKLHDDVSKKEQKTDSSLPIQYVQYESELQMPMIVKLIQKDLSEPYSIYTYRYFIHNWPKLCFLAMSETHCVGAIVCKLDLHRDTRRGYIAMLAVDENYRKRGIGSTLVRKAIQEMVEGDAEEVVLETEITNKPALQLYEALGFVRDKRLFRYYLNGVDALRLKLWLR